MIMKKQMTIYPFVRTYVFLQSILAREESNNKEIRKNNSRFEKH